MMAMAQRATDPDWMVSAMSDDVLNLPEPEDENQPTWVIARKVYPKNVCPTTCAVCGDSASGYHYEVPSCNGCKTFFRRTVLSQRKYECKKGGRCFATLPKDRRCSCRACRFQQCVVVGMNPLAIQQVGDATNNEVLLGILDRRRSLSDCGPGPSKEPKVLPSLHVLENSIDRLIDELVYLEIKTDKFRKSSYNPTPVELPRLEDALSTSSLLSLADKLEPMPNWPLEPIEHFIPRVHSSKEECECPMLSERERKNWFFFDILSCVEWAKTFPVLHKLARSDQLILLKFVVLQCFNATQAFFSYENKSDSVIHPDGTKPHFFANIFTLVLSWATIIKQRLLTLMFVLVSGVLTTSHRL